MEKLFIFVCCAVFAVLGQDEPAKITLENPENRFLNLGEEITVSFSIDRGIVTMYRAKLLTLIINDRNEEKVLFEGINPIDAQPTYYSIKDKMPEDPSLAEMGYTVTIKEVRAEDEGRFVVRYFSPDNTDDQAPDASEEFQINILRPIETVSLKFDTFQEVISTQENPLEVDAGAYSVQCSAMGSNPAVTDLKLYLHNQPVAAEIQTARMEVEERRFKSTIKAMVDIKSMDSNQNVECVAQQPSEIASEGPISVAVPIKVNKYDPEISCNKSKAYPGMMYPKLTCTVSHAGLDIKDFRYKIKKTGEEITVEKMGKNNERVEVTDMGNDKTKVILDLYNAKDWHFDTEFFLVVENQNGYVTQFPVKLTKIPGGNGNKAAFVSTSMTAILLCVILGTLLRLQ